MNKLFPRSALLGALLWLVAAVALRLVGQGVLHPDPASLLGAFLIAGVLMAVLGPILRLRLSRDPAAADTIALGLILPGMLGDVGIALAFPHVYPNLPPALGDSFAALALWCYAVAGLAITLHARLDGGRDAGADDGRSGRDRRGDHDQGMARPA